MIRISTPTTAHQHESRDSLGIGKLVEGQLRATIQLIKDRKLLNEPAPKPNGTRGIVIAGGGKYAQWALVNCMWLRQRGIKHHIQVWHLGPKEIPKNLRPHFESLDVELVDALSIREKHWMRKLGGWELKAFCAARAPFDEVCFVDADCLLSADPAAIWDDPEYQDAGSLFFSDVNNCRKGNWHYFYANVPTPTKEFESGVYFWNRQKCWLGILMTCWILEHSEIWFRLTYGDKETFYLGFGTTQTPFIQSMECEWKAYGIRQSWKGQEIARHSMSWKRNDPGSVPPSPVIPRMFEQVRDYR